MYRREEMLDMHPHQQRGTFRYYGTDVCIARAFEFGLEKSILLFWLCLIAHRISFDNRRLHVWFTG